MATRTVNIMTVWSQPVNLLRLGWGRIVCAQPLALICPQSMSSPDDIRMDMERWWNEKNIRGFKLAPVKRMSHHSKPLWGRYSKTKQDKAWSAVQGSDWQRLNIKSKPPLCVYTQRKYLHIRWLITKDRHQNGLGGCQLYVTLTRGERQLMEKQSTWRKRVQCHTVHHTP